MNTISELFTLYTCLLVTLMFLCNVPLPFFLIIHIVVIFDLAIYGLSIISHVCVICLLTLCLIFFVPLPFNVCILVNYIL